MTDSIEFYPTPQPLADYLFERFLWQVPTDLFSQQDEDGKDVPVQVLEPSAGKGAFARAMARLGHPVTAIDPNFDDPQIEGVEWERTSLEALYELLDGERPFDLVCGNPPFSLAEEHLKLLLKMVRKGGCIGFLLRSGFLGSAGRAPFFAAYPPKHVYVLSNRPSFVWSYICKEEGCGQAWVTPPEPSRSELPCPFCKSGNFSISKTDRYDYMFAIWEVGMDPSRTTTLSWLTRSETDT